MSTLKKAVLAAVVVALAATAVLVSRSLEPLHPPGEPQSALPGPDTTRLASNEPLAGHEQAEVRSPVDAVPAPAPVAAPTRASVLLQLHWHDGAPAAGVVARIYSNGFEDFYADAFDVCTGEDGTYLVESLPPGRASAYLDRGPVGDCKVAAGERGKIELTIPRGFDLAGEVVERDGRPVAGAQVLSDSMGNGWNAFPVARTDAQGRFRIRSIRPGLCWITARAALHPPSPQYEFIGGAVDIEGARIVLEPQGAAVSGTVFDPRGEPLAHAQVLLGKEQSYDQYKLEGGGDARVPAAQCASTDEHGRFEFGGAPLGRLEVQARGKGCAPWKGEVETASAVRAQLVIRMQKGAQLSGRATDAGGKPVARAEIQVGAYGFASRYTRADAEGGFRLENLPLGEFEAEAQADGFEHAKAKLFGSSGAALEWNPVLGSGLAIRGRLVARDTDFSKWWMYCESQDWQKSPYAQSATPKADGSFEFAGCGAARHRIRIHAPGANLYPVATVEAQPGGEPLIIPIETSMLPTCHLRGRILDENGQPLGGAQFSPVLASASYTPIETADAEGRFDLGPVPPGEYRIVARIAGYCMFNSEKAALAASANWDFGDLQLKRGGVVSVHLVRASPKPVAVELVREGQSVAWISVQDGIGRSDALEPGEYELRPWVDGTLVEAASAYPRVSVRAGEENSVELELP